MHACKHLSDWVEYVCVGQCVRACVRACVCIGAVCARVRVRMFARVRVCVCVRARVGSLRLNTTGQPLDLKPNGRPGSSPCDPAGYRAGMRKPAPA